MSGMRIFGLSNHGLTVIAVLVAVLWTVLLAERRFMSQAEQDFEDMMKHWRPAVSKPAAPFAPGLELPLTSMNFS